MTTYDVSYEASTVGQEEVFDLHMVRETVLGVPGELRGDALRNYMMKRLKDEKGMIANFRNFQILGS